MSRTAEALELGGNPMRLGAFLDSVSLGIPSTELCIFGLLALSIGA